MTWLVDSPAACFCAFPGAELDDDDTMWQCPDCGRVWEIVGRQCCLVDDPGRATPRALMARGALRQGRRRR
jgi:hypothetical protein